MTVYSDQTSNRNDRGVDWAIYRTKKGKYLVYRHVWSLWQGERGYAEYYVMDKIPGPDSTIKTKDGDYIEVPAGLVQKAMEAVGQMVEILDI